MQPSLRAFTLTTPLPGEVEAGAKTPTSLHFLHFAVRCSARPARGPFSPFSKD